MKRAAGQIRKVRKNSSSSSKDNKEKDSYNNADGSGAQQQQNSDHHAQQQQQQQQFQLQQQQQRQEQSQVPVRRKPTQEEAGLTAKNYRLAKELSDLRVRHREECKAVSRMTMENMNLASRWRDAVAHVSKYKKALAMEQRRNAETMHSQQHQRNNQQPPQLLATSQSSPPRHHLQQQLSGSPSSEQHQMTQYVPTPPMTPSADQPSPSGAQGAASLSDVAAEMNKMDRILAAHQSASPPTPSPPTKATANANHGIAPRISTSPPVIAASASSGSFPDLLDPEEEKPQSRDQPVTPSPERRPTTNNKDNNNDDGFGSQQKENGEDFFAMFQGDTKVDLDETVDDADDDDLPLEPPPTVIPSESPPPSPRAESPPITMATTATRDKTDFDTINGPFTAGGDSSSRKDTASPLFPVTASPKLVAGKSKIYNDGFPGDITSDNVRHPRSNERTTDTDFNDIDEEDYSASVPTSASSLPTASMSIAASQPTQSAAAASAASTRASPPSSTNLSGIDAFEASFATQFPNSFSPSEENHTNTENTTEEQQTATAVEEYNPFFPSPSKNSGAHSNRGSPPSESSRYPHVRRGLHENSPSPVAEGITNSYGGDMDSPSNVKTSNNMAPIRSSWRNGLTSTVNDDLTNTQTPPTGYSPTSDATVKINTNQGTNGNNASPPDNAIRRGRGVGYGTPPEYRSPEQDPGSDGPQRPEKAGAAAARARYEKALQPRANGRRFPRKSLDGTSPAGGEGSQSTKSPGTDPGVKERSSNVTQTGSSYELAARAQARISGRASLSALESNNYSSLRDTHQQSQPHQPWDPRPSPSDSVGSKPWDEIGDIPMDASPPSKNATLIGPSPSHTIASYTSASPVSNNTSAATSSGRSSYTRNALARNRPWDTRTASAGQQQASAYTTSTNNGMNFDTTNQPGAQHIQQKGSFGEETESPPSRFVAAGKTRRSVKQPVSYAEPSLNSKLRRGDVFFTKQQQQEDEDDRKNYPATAVHL